MKSTELLSQENKIFDIPELNRFRLGDHVVAEGCADYDRFEGVVIGIDLHRDFASRRLHPSITILHDGDQLTDGFRPDDLSLAASPPPPVEVTEARVLTMADFPSTGNEEAEWIAYEEEHDCPYCGGSGHVDDAKALEEKIAAEIASLRKQLEEARAKALEEAAKCAETCQPRSALLRQGIAAAIRSLAQEGDKP